MPLPHSSEALAHSLSFPPSAPCSGNCIEWQLETAYYTAKVGARVHSVPSVASLGAMAATAATTLVGDATVVMLVVDGTSTVPLDSYLDAYSKFLTKLP